jgi:hypothetical protein
MTHRDCRIVQLFRAIRSSAIIDLSCQMNLLLL